MCEVCGSRAVVADAASGDARHVAGRHLAGAAGDGGRQPPRDIPGPGTAGSRQD